MTSATLAKQEVVMCGRGRCGACISGNYTSTNLAVAMPGDNSFTPKVL
jgi:hypothetical protein